MAVISSNALTGITTRMADGAMSAGSIIQVVQSTKTDTASFDYSTSAQDVGLTASITPSATSSKILIQYLCNVGWTSSLSQWVLHLLRGSTEIGQGDSSTSRISARQGAPHYQPYNFLTHALNDCYLDSPATTSSITYKLQITGAAGSGTLYINRSGRDGQYTTYDQRLASSMVLMEVAA